MIDDMNESMTLTAGATTTASTTPAVLKRCAIIGTAPSWTMTPWNDQTLEKWGLNDGYLLGIPVASRWYDLHPFHQMCFHPRDRRHVPQSEVPIGAYLRPEGHLDWLKSRQFPVYLAEPHPEYPNARVFPKQQVLDFWRPYWPMRLTRKHTIVEGPDWEVSTPAWMLMQAVAEGYREVFITGIHLATEWEYVHQAPNCSFLIGVAIGLGVKVVLPETAPICKASYQYAFAPKADLPQQQAQHRIQAIKAEGAQLQQALVALPWYARAKKADLTRRLRHLDIELMDAKAQFDRARVLSVA